MDDQQTINVLKGLVIDGVDKAKAGHPGGAMSSMDFAYVLFTEYLRFDPQDPQWQGRDRFILSAGHESMLLYSMLHLMGWLEMDELKRFRQLHSKTPGHPENFLTKGVECTTGPLGQGAAMSVGFSIAQTKLAAALDEKLFGHKTYVLMGDGCMQEDITLGAASLAGHLGLSNLVWYYDKNSAQISGHISRATSDDEAKIFSGFGWNVIPIDGHNRDAIRKALDQATGKSERPTIIIGKTIMAHGAHSMEGDHNTHGAPLPKEERLKTREKLGLPADEAFYLPKTAILHFQRNFGKKADYVKSWHAALKDKQKNPDFQTKYKNHFDKMNFDKLSSITWNKEKPLATRNAFGEILEKWTKEVPNLVGGSADLEPSNMTEGFAKMVGDFSKTNRNGRNIAFGVREFPMSAISNGIALHGGFIPFDATFLSFSDYSRAALRLGAIQRARVIHEFTHDSFYLGEDGPTHQAVEHVMSLRLIPNFYLMRPADVHETEVMFREALKLDAPSAICLSRQKLPVLDLNSTALQNAAKGGYIIHEIPGAEYVIFATGSEVSLAIDVAKKIGKTRVVSLPCWELFDKQSQSYKDEVFSHKIKKRISVEAGATLGWQRFTGIGGLNIGFDRYGDSAPLEILAVEYGFTAEAICAKIKAHSFS